MYFFLSSPFLPLAGFVVTVVVVVVCIVLRSKNGAEESFQGNVKNENENEIREEDLIAYMYKSY